MAIIKTEDIRGYKVEDGGIFCSDCASDTGNTDEPRLDEIILASDIEDDDLMYFCDRCMCLIK